MATANARNATTQRELNTGCVNDPAQAFRNAMRQLAGGVSVITACQGAQRTGLTATSVVSLSMDPAELLISVNQNASACPLILKTKRFGVNVLSASLLDVAERFSGKGGICGEQRYQDALWERDEHGVWLLSDALATFSCEVGQLWEHRTHVLIVGKVVGVHSCHQANEPLTYWQGQYGGFCAQPALKN